jgi:CheY-like chemotaxis protein
MLATNILASLGATVEQCENGEEAVRLVDEGLKRDYPNLPYDYILMDCQVYIMTMEYGLVSTPLMGLFCHLIKLTK